MKIENDIKLLSIVVPDSIDADFVIGRVIGMPRFDLVGVGPLLQIRDFTTGKVVERFPMGVRKLVLAPKTNSK